jgi:hypothetical protein
MIKKLVVKPVPGKLVQDFEALDQSVKRFIGWSWDPEIAGWRMQDGTFEIPFTAEYFAALKSKDLEPGDAATQLFLIKNS